MLKSPVYLVPFDFTEIAKSAMNIALNLAKSNDGSVYLLHVVKKESEVSEATDLLNMTVDVLITNEQHRIVTKVIEGNLYEEVGRASNLLDAKVNIMGTHGAYGMQRIMGSNALKMVSKSPTPFLLLVKPEVTDKFETIVMPFSFVKETLHVLESLVDLAQQFNSIVHLVGYHDDSEWLKSQSIENQAIARDFLVKKGVACEIVNLPKNKSYEEEISDYMYTVRADLIAASYFKNGILPPPNSFIQVMLDNDHEIPVLTVNGDSNKTELLFSMNENQD